MKQSLPGSLAQWMFLLAFITLFVLLNLGFFHFFNFGFGLWNLPYIALSEYMVLGLAFAHLQDTMMPLYHRLNSRVDNLLGTNLSVGHNNLYRVEAIKNVGRFAENYLAEDFATSTEILRGNWSCKTVPVVSYERIPENLSEYSRRQSRWAFQTFQLLSLDVRGLSMNMRLKMLMTLHHHAAPVAALIGMALLVFFSSTRGVFPVNINLLN